MDFSIRKFKRRRFRKNSLQQKLRDFISEARERRPPTFTVEEACREIYGTINYKSMNLTRTRISKHRRTTGEMVFNVGNGIFVALRSDANQEWKLKFAKETLGKADREYRTGTSHIDFSDDLFQILDEIRSLLPTELLMVALEKAIESSRKSRTAENIAKNLKEEVVKRIKKDEDED